MTDLSGYDSESDVQITAVSELEGQADAESGALEQAMSDNQDSLDQMRARINANMDLMQSLEAEGYTADDVIAVQSNGDTGVTFIVNDKM